MNRFFWIFLSLAFPLLIFAEEKRIYEIEVGQFDKIKILDNVNVVYRCLPDSTGMAFYESEEELDNPFLLTSNGKGLVKIQVSSDYVGKPNLPTLFVYSDFLTSVENSSDATITIEHTQPCAEFKATQVGNGSINVHSLNTTNVSAKLNTGNGTITLDGECQKAVFNLVGSGLIAADRLQADNIDCKFVGSGSIGCWAIESINIKGIGSTKIYYKGQPNIKKTGGGKVFRLPESNSARLSDSPTDSNDE